MKNKKNIALLLIAVTAALLAACSSEPLHPGSDAESAPVIINATQAWNTGQTRGGAAAPVSATRTGAAAPVTGDSPAAATRAVKQSFVLGDEIIINHDTDANGTIDTDEAYRYRLTTDGWQPATPADQLRIAVDAQAPTASGSYTGESPETGSPAAGEPGTGTSPVGDDLEAPQTPFRPTVGSDGRKAWLINLHFAHVNAAVDLTLYDATLTPITTAKKVVITVSTDDGTGTGSEQNITLQPSNASPTLEIGSGASPVILPPGDITKVTVTTTTDVELSATFAPGKATLVAGTRYPLVVQVIE